MSAAPQIEWDDTMCRQSEKTPFRDPALVLPAAEKAAKSYRAWAALDSANGLHERAKRMLEHAEFYEREADYCRDRLAPKEEAA